MRLKGNALPVEKALHNERRTRDHESIATRLQLQDTSSCTNMRGV